MRHIYAYFAILIRSKTKMCSYRKMPRRVACGARSRPRGTRDTKPPY